MNTKIQYATVESETGDKKHILRYDTELLGRRLMCGTSMNIVEESMEFWDSKDELFIHSGVCENCQHRIHDPEATVETYETKVEQGDVVDYKVEDNTKNLDSNEDKSEGSKSVFSQITSFFKNLI